MKANLYKVKNMGKEFINGQMVMFTKVTFNLIKDKD